MALKIRTRDAYSFGLSGIELYNYWVYVYTLHVTGLWKTDELEMNRVVLGHYRKALGITPYSN